MKIENNNNTNISELTERLKGADARYAQIVKALRVVYYVLVPIYFILMLVQLFTNSSLFEVGGTLCILVSMLIFALLFRNYYKEFNYVDYAQPTLIMLKKAAQRYKPFQKKAWWVLLAVTIMGIGMVLINLEFSPIIVSLVYGSLMLISVIIGLVWWYFRYKPLRDATLQLIQEIENNVL